MKKKIVAIALIAGLSIATAASANWGRGGHGFGGGYGNCPQMQGQGPMMQQLDPETKAKVTQFFKDNQALHKQLTMKRAEKQALMRSDKVDPQAAAKVAGELFDLQTTLHEKAAAAGVEQYLGPMGMGGRRGMGFDGPGFGRGMMNSDNPGPAGDAPQQ
jgi:Spy/CpxP family protein refolding chaperone